MVFAGLWNGPARASPPAIAPEGEDPVAASDDATEREIRELYTRANEASERGNYALAIELLERAHDLASCEVREQLRSQLAQLHRSQFAVDGDPQHLRTARELLQRQLNEFDRSDEIEAATRLEVQAMLEQVNLDLSATEQAQAERQRQLEAAAAKLAELEQAQREAAIREAAAQAEQRRRQRTFGIMLGAGVPLLGLGLGSLGVMGGAVAAGARAEADGQALATSAPIDRDALEQTRARGQTANQIAWATGVLGGVLFAAGTTTVAYAIAHRRGRPRPTSRARLTARGLEF
jgi:DNA repair exonuclease SbcCD ATPase subunit